MREIQQANKAVRKAQTHQVSLSYPSSFDLNSCFIVGYTDASFGNLPDGGSQGAYFIFLCDKNGQSVPMAWQSRRIRRAANSTLAAECIAAVEAAEACFHIQIIIKEIVCKNVQTQTMHIPIRILCDNRSLVDAVHTSTAVQNKRLQMVVGILREMINKSEL